MGRLIVKLSDHYLAWSTVCDAPVSRGMLFDEFSRYWQRQNLETDSLMRVIDRVNEFGTSMPDETLRDTLCLNSAGKDSSGLTALEIYDYYCLQQSGGDLPIGDVLKGVSLSHFADTGEQWFDSTISEDGTKLLIPEAR
jgi:hypothetical protein